MSKQIDIRENVTLEQIDNLVGDILRLADSMRRDVEANKRRWEAMQREAEIALAQVELNSMKSIFGGNR